MQRGEAKNASLCESVEEILKADGYSTVEDS